MTDRITPKLEPQVEQAIAIPDPRVRKLAKIAEQGEAAIANLKAITAERADEA